MNQTSEDVGSTSFYPNMQLVFITDNYFNHCLIHPSWTNPYFHVWPASIESPRWSLFSIPLFIKLTIDPFVQLGNYGPGRNHSFFGGQPFKRPTADGHKECASGQGVIFE